MSLNWFERGTYTTPAPDTPADYVAWAKRAYEHIRQQQQVPVSEPTPPPESPPVEEAPPAPTSFLARAAALRQSRLAALKASLVTSEPAAPEVAPVPVPTPATPAPELDEGFLWSAEILAAQGRRPEEVTLEEINWLQKLRQGLAKTRRSVLNQLKAIVGQGPLDERAVTELETLLLQADVGVTVTDWVIQQIQAQIRQEALPPELALKLLSGLLRQVLERPYQHHAPNLTPVPGQLNIWLITGVNGVGKTTTIGKLAHLATKSGYKCLIAAADTFRAAAVEQVKIWGERAGVGVVSNPSANADPAAVVFDAIGAAQSRGVELLLVDTAGRLQNKQNLMAELQKVRRIIDKKAVNATVESLLVLDATLGQNGLRQAQVFTEAANLTGVILTKLDGTARGGIALAITQELGLPIRFVGAGEGLMDLRPFSSYEFVEALMGI
ncbi:signal recognition particle-docking protein FtsY [Gloeomargarita lithophora Alchichica-D10]|uniref:Signal recognition particle receptor FtsY n=1 Tax=Gloeomargarita lithophora Alchichica-D10 TaxID=1188229 RepID=A0A1J0ADK5_9CYAN|nr:signal recognition particle-docking protein FtsY [Gloeomargarita lithophora]APB34018.1 signal recognition particle-docking protein FtsY [Gloeomargarita lithophora Alchichica-D10]